VALINDHLDAGDSFLFVTPYTLAEDTVRHLEKYVCLIGQLCEHI
jgi:hypothetical protein